MHLRPMRVEDLDAVLQIEQRSFASPWRREHFQAELDHDDWARPQVVTHDSKLVAYAVVWELASELRINNFAVDPSRRRNGIGRWMLGRLLEHAKHADCTEATLEVRAGNTAALDLYRRFGFEVIGRRAGYYSREGEDALLMRRSLLAERD
jgi:ribosomal-protein-alanine N-acetyltransferase